MRGAQLFGAITQPFATHILRLPGETRVRSACPSCVFDSCLSASVDYAHSTQALRKDLLSLSGGVRGRLPQDQPLSRVQKGEQPPAGGQDGTGLSRAEGSVCAKSKRCGWMLDRVRGPERAWCGQSMRSEGEVRETRPEGLAALHARGFPPGHWGVP